MRGRSRSRSARCRYLLRALLENILATIVVLAFMVFAVWLNGI